MSYKDYIILIFGSFLLIAMTGIANADNIDANAFGKCKQKERLLLIVKTRASFTRSGPKKYCMVVNQTKIDT